MTDLLLDQETAQLISHVTQLSKFQQTLSEIKQATPREDIKGPPLFCPGDLVLVKSPNPTQDLTPLSGRGHIQLFCLLQWQCERLAWIPGSIT
jgi:hypothetical protein